MCTSFPWLNTGGYGTSHRIRPTSAEDARVNHPCSAAWWKEQAALAQSSLNARLLALQFCSDKTLLNKDPSTDTVQTYNWCLAHPEHGASMLGQHGVHLGRSGL